MTAEVIERPGAQATSKFVRMSASKARVVLNLVRGKKVLEAQNILMLTDRRAAEPVTKLLNSAVANAEHNEEIPGEELYISECFADEGATIKRFRPRARGRASRIHKQTCHITLRVSRYTDDELEMQRDAASRKADSDAAKAKASKKKSTAKKSTSRADRVAKSKAADQVEAEATDETLTEEKGTEEVETPPTPDEAEATAVTEEAEATEEAEVAEESESSEETETPPMPDAEASDDSEDQEEGEA